MALAALYRLAEQDRVPSHWAALGVATSGLDFSAGDAVIAVSIVFSDRSPNVKNWIIRPEDKRVYPKVHQTRITYANRDRYWPYTPELLMKQGVDPSQAGPEIAQTLQELVDQGQWLIGTAHRGFLFPALQTLPELEAVTQSSCWLDLMLLCQALHYVQKDRPEIPLRQYLSQVDSYPDKPRRNLDGLLSQLGVTDRPEMRHLKSYSARNIAIKRWIAFYEFLKQGQHEQQEAGV